MAHREIKRICAVQNEFRSLAGNEKRSVTAPVTDEALKNVIAESALKKIETAITISDKLMRQNTLDEVLKELIEKVNTGDEDMTMDIIDVFNDIEKNLVRDMILNENTRADGRGPDEIRQISSEIGILPRTHGSALFVRGETQCLAVVTLGTSDDEQRIDSLDGESFKTFMLHYNFPPFSVGEVKPLRSPGRREIGHGMLAERALRLLSRQRSEFPYTIRIVSDILGV